MGLVDIWVWIDGSVRPLAEARISVLDRGFLYGDSVYEVTRTHGGRPQLLGPHLDRLERSAAGLAMSLPPRADIEAAIAAVCAKAAWPPLGSVAMPGPRAPVELYLRIMVTRGEGELGLDPALADAPRLIVIARPVQPPPPRAYVDGVAVVLSRRSRTAPELKTGNYLSSVMAVREARLAGAHEALLRDGVGRITEGSSSNLFLVIGGRLMTPPLAAGLLPGITRAQVIEVARSAGLGVDEAPVWQADLDRAAEVFLTSSIRGVLPVTLVDGKPVGNGRPGEVTRRVMALYQATTVAGWPT